MTNHPSGTEPATGPCNCFPTPDNPVHHPSCPAAWKATEAEPRNAPSWYSSDEASAWAAGYNAALRSSPPTATSGNEIRFEGDGDWCEDFGHENGRYINTCVECGESFTGHKRRVVCKRCSRPAVPTQEGLSVICRRCDKLVGGEEAGDKVCWVVCSDCIASLTAGSPEQENEK